MDTEFTSLVFLRPVWLWALLPLIASWLAWWRIDARGASGWDACVDPELRPYVIEAAGEGGRSLAGPLALLAGWSVTILILSGPVFERRPVPVVEARASEVVLFDLSRSMLADDVAPDRLARARFKFADLLARAGDTRIALVGFAERPYVISPLTSDVDTLRAFIPSLSPDVVPVQGSRLDLAIASGAELLENAGVQAGSILAITDALPTQADIAAAREVNRRGHTLSVLGVGTEAGAPVRAADGQFMKQSSGAIVVARLDFAALDALARAGGGSAVRLSDDASDLDRIAQATSPLPVGTDGERNTAEQRWWVERGPWLLWPIALAALALFRRDSLA